MSVNFNAGLFMRNCHMQNNAVQKAPAASLSTPLAADKTGLSFNRGNKKVGFGIKIPEINEPGFIPAVVAAVQNSSPNGQRIALTVLNGIKPTDIPPSVARKGTSALTEVSSSGLPAVHRAKQIFWSASKNKEV